MSLASLRLQGLRCLCWQSKALLQFWATRQGVVTDGGVQKVSHVFQVLKPDSDLPGKVVRSLTFLSHRKENKTEDAPGGTNKGAGMEPHSSVEAGCALAQHRCLFPVGTQGV